ncbi:MAG: biotin/lipoyl-binding protein, partial [Myxococcota bacterium]
MGESFARTTRSLRADRGGGWLLALVLGTGLLAVWCGWMGLARVPVRSVSVRARIESALVPRDVQAAVAGVVTEIPVRLGDRVSQGDPIVRLDDADARSARTDAAARVDGLRSQVERLSL